jgi:hypothetical protein
LPWLLRVYSARVSLIESLPVYSTPEITGETRPVVLISVRKTATQRSALDVGEMQETVFFEGLVSLPAANSYAA